MLSQSYSFINIQQVVAEYFFGTTNDDRQKDRCLFNLNDPSFFLNKPENFLCNMKKVPEE